MKKILSNAGILIVVILCLIGSSCYFYIHYAITLSNAENLKTEIESAKVLKNEVENRKPVYNEKDLEFLSLSEDLQQLQEDVKVDKEADNKVEEFLSSYDFAMDYNLSGIDTYEEKQEYIKKQLAPFFTEKAFEKTEYYTIVSQPEFVTSERKVGKQVKIVQEVPRQIKNSNKNIIRIYFQSNDSEQAEVILKISDEFKTSKWVYQRLEIKRIDGEYKITDYEILNADYVV